MKLNITSNKPVLFSSLIVIISFICQYLFSHYDKTVLFMYYTIIQSISEKYIYFLIIAGIPLSLYFISIIIKNKEFWITKLKKHKKWILFTLFMLVILMNIAYWNAPQVNPDSLRLFYPSYNISNSKISKFSNAWNNLELAVKTAQASNYSEINVNSYLLGSVRSAPVFFLGFMIKIFGESLILFNIIFMLFYLGSATITYLTSEKIKKGSGIYSLMIFLSFAYLAMMSHLYIIANIVFFLSLIIFYLSLIILKGIENKTIGRTKTSLLIISILLLAAILKNTTRFSSYYFALIIFSLIILSIFNKNQQKHNKRSKLLHALLIAAIIATIVDFVFELYNFYNNNLKLYLKGFNSNFIKNLISPLNIAYQLSFIIFGTFLALLIIKTRKHLIAKIAIAIVLSMHILLSLTTRYVRFYQAFVRHDLFLFPVVAIFIALSLQDSKPWIRTFLRTMIISIFLIGVVMNFLIYVPYIKSYTDSVPLLTIGKISQNYPNAKTIFIMSCFNNSQMSGSNLVAYSDMYLNKKANIKILSCINFCNSQQNNPLGTNLYAPGRWENFYAPNNYQIADTSLFKNKLNSSVLIIYFDKSQKFIKNFRNLFNINLTSYLEYSKRSFGIYPEINSAIIPNPKWNLICRKQLT